MSSSWLKTAVQRSKAAWQVLTQKYSTSSVGASCQSDLSNVSQACSAESVSSFTSASGVEHTCTSSSSSCEATSCKSKSSCTNASCIYHTCTTSSCNTTYLADSPCKDATETIVHDHETSVNTKIQQAQESLAIEHDFSTANHETESERTKQVLRFSISSEIMHLSTDGTYVYPVKTPEQLIQENIGKIALLQRSMDASELEFKYLVQPMIYACARMCLMLPGSNHHHDSFTGGLFAHNLNLALTALDKLHQFDTRTGSKSKYSLGSRCSIREELMHKFKLNSLAFQDDARCFAEVWSAYQQQRITKEQEFYQYENLNIQSSAALNYLQHTFAPLLEFDAQHIAKVSSAVKCRWESFMPHKSLTLKLPDAARCVLGQASFDHSSSFQNVSAHYSSFQNVSAHSSSAQDISRCSSVHSSSFQSAAAQSTQQCNLKAADTAVHEIQLRQERLNLLNTLLSVPQLNITTFEALLNMLPSEAKSAVECFLVKEQLYRNSCYEREALLPYTLDLCEDEFELEQLAKLSLQGYSQDEQQFLLRQKSSLNFAVPINKMRTELSNSHPHLSSSQLNFAMQMMCLFAALTHDLGKVIHDLEIFADNGEKFNATVGALADFVERTQTKVLYVRFKESRRLEHNNLILHGSWLFARECPHSFDFVAHYFNLDQIFGSRTHPVLSIIKSSDILSAALFKEHPISPYLLQMVIAEAVVKAYHWFKLYAKNAHSTHLNKNSCSKHTDDLHISNLDTKHTPNLDKERAPDLSTERTDLDKKCLGDSTFSLCDYLRLHKGVNDLYSEIYVRSRDVLIVMRSAMEAELAAALNIAQKGELGRLSLMTCIPSWSCTLVRTGISPIVTSTRRLSFFKVRCGQDLVIVRGFDVTMQAFEISQNVAQADYLPISKDDNLLQYLLQGLRYLSKEVLKVFQEVKNYTQQDDCSVAQLRQRLSLENSETDDYTKEDSSKDDSENDSIYKIDIQSPDHLVGGKAFGCNFNLDAHFVQAMIDRVGLMRVAFQFHSTYDYAYLGCTWMLQSRSLQSQEFCLLTY